VTWTSLLLVALGSAFGGVARYGLGEWMAFDKGTGFPWGTIVANVSGCLIIGFAYGMSNRPWVRTFVAIGVCGGYTTFSSFGLQTLQLAQEERLAAAGVNIALSLVACLLAVWLGYALAKLLSPSPAITAA
jgi:fluoride exporter